MKSFIEKNSLNVLRMFSLKRLEDEKTIMYIVATEGENKDFEYRIHFPEEGKAKYRKRDITININERNLTDEIKKVNFKSTGDMLEYSLIKNQALMKMQVVNGTSEFDGETKIVCRIKSEGMGTGLKFYEENLFTEENIDVTEVKSLWIESNDNEEYREILMNDIFKNDEQSEKVEKCKKLFEAMMEEGEKRNKELENFLEEQEKNQEN